MPLRKAGPETQPVVSPVVEINPPEAAIATVNAIPEPTYDRESYWRNGEYRDVLRDKRMSRAGLYQAALQSPALMQYAPTLADYQKLVEQIADAGLEYVNR